MRVLILAVAAILAPSSAFATEPQIPASSAASPMPVINPGGTKQAHCPATIAYQAMKKGKPLTGQKLSDLPPANLYLSVYRKIDGCEVPVIARYGIGATGETESPRR